MVNSVRDRVSLREAVGSAEHVRSFIELLDLDGRRWGLVGGAARKWLGEPATPLNDVDVVVDADPSKVRLAIFQWHRRWADSGGHVSMNAFGGYRLMGLGQDIDVWSASMTAGVLTGKVRDRDLFAAVARCAALSLDSIVVASDGRIYDHGYRQSLASGILTLNHCYIERPASVAQKAVRLCLEYRLEPDLSVQDLITRELGSGYVKG